MKIDYPRANRSGLRRFLPSWRQWSALVGIVVLVGFLGMVQLYRTADVSAVVPPQATTLYYSDGETVLGQFGANRRNVPLSSVPRELHDAVLAAEDRDFYSHGGFSVTGFGRAAWEGITGGSKQGGSTITQQYAKNAYLSHERTYERKLKELVLSVKLNQTRTKEQILEDYLNTIYFGRGAYGVEAASQAYFKRPVADLNLRQSAALASILRSPGYYDPDDVDGGGRQRLEDRWSYVLDAMVEEGWLTPERRAGAKFPKIAKRQESTGSLAGPNGFLVDMVKQELAALNFDEERLAQGGLSVVTTFDKDAQEGAVDAVEDNLPTTGAEGVRAGLVSVDARTGGVIAVYGGSDFTSQYNAATVGRPQAGSTFKPFGLVAALREDVSLDQRLNGSSPAKFELDDGSTYPATGDGIVNFGGSSYGSVSLLSATQRSVNTAYVDLNLQVGPEKLVEVAELAGLPASTPGLADVQGNNVLGFAAPRVIDMASAYATFANDGLRMERHVISEVRGSNGGVLHRARSNAQRAFTVEVMEDTNYAMQRVVSSGTATRATALGRPAAGKTGTTNDNRAAWFVGYTPQVSTAVALYREDSEGRPQSLNGLGGSDEVTGGSYPTQIWTDFMKVAMDGEPVERFSRTVSAPSSPRSEPSGSDAAEDDEDTAGTETEETPAAEPSRSVRPSTSASATPVTPTTAAPDPRPTDPETDEPTGSPPDPEPSDEGAGRPGRPGDGNSGARPGRGDRPGR